MKVPANDVWEAEQQQAMPKVGPPSVALWLRESVALAELGSCILTIPRWRHAPRGDGHPVLVLPGLMQSDLATFPLRTFLATQGYAVHRWGLGRNNGRADVSERLLGRLRELHERHQRKVSLVGWSMGGLFARDLARRMPDAVRQVITLGSPVSGDPKASNAWALYELMSGERADDAELRARYRDSVPVPTTSIFSRRDGIVAWQCCLNEPGPQAENIEVVSSHCGMGHHPAVLFAIAERLAQAEGHWRPFAGSPARNRRAAAYSPAAPRPSSA
jgi:pimeloyl-ACP methyl ester carboxylesterase